MRRSEGFHFDAVIDKMDEFFNELGQRVEVCMDKMSDSRVFNKVTSTVDEVATDLTRVTKKMIKRIIK